MMIKAANANQIEEDQATRNIKQAMKNGALRKCPSCGQGHLFKKFTTINQACASCDMAFTGHQADDAPPYFTILIAGHIIVPLILEIGRHNDWSSGLQLLVMLPLLALAVWYLLPVTKGALIGIQWANKMHGFNDAVTDDQDVTIVT